MATENEKMGLNIFSLSFIGRLFSGKLLSKENKYIC